MGNPPNTTSSIDRTRSRMAENATQIRQQGAQETPLAIIKSDDGAARAWRVTLSRLNRKDNRAPAVDNGSPSANLEFPSQAFPYAAATMTFPTVPPRRSNAVLDIPSANGRATFVQIAFGMGTNTPTRLLGNWPLLGGSIVVVGSYVEVFGGQYLNGPFVAEDADGELGAYSASIVPAEGADQEDCGELSLTQFLSIEPFKEGAPAAFATSFAGNGPIAHQQTSFAVAGAGVFTTPFGATVADVIAIGGGGAGGDGATSGGGSGAGGNSSRTATIPVSSVEAVALQVGAGGVAPGGAGGPSFFRNLATLRANGGLGGGVGSPANQGSGGIPGAVGVGTVQFNGGAGNGSIGAIASGAGGGGGGGTTAGGNGGAGGAPGAAGAGGVAGAGGTGGPGPAAATAGIVAGGGGAGGSGVTAPAGAAGADGTVLAQSDGFWGATLRALVAGAAANGHTWSVAVQSVTADDVRLNQRFDLGTGTWVAAPNNLGIATDSGGTIADLEAQINGAALFANVSAASPTPLALLSFAEDTETTGVFAGGADAGCATEGGQVYVPDFARRVRVQLVESDDRFCGHEMRVPSPPLVAQLVWYDDQGSCVGAEYQSAILNADWYVVPARAVLLGVYSPGLTEESAAVSAWVHWRIAP